MTRPKFVKAAVMTGPGKVKRLYIKFYNMC
jgi:hypothetical protein